VQSLRIVKAKETHRHAVIASKFRSDGSHVPTGELNAAGRKHIRK
jgi:hypothetical protein